MTLQKFIGLIVVAAALVAPAATSGAERAGHADAASVDVRPRTAFAGSGARILVRIPADAENRRLRLVVDSGDFSSSSEIDLAGDQAPRAHWFTLQGLPAGEYLVEATVFGSTGPRSRVVGRFTRE